MTGDSADLVTALELICAPKKLERDKGEVLFQSLALGNNDLSNICSWTIEKLDGLSNWEDVHGGLVAARILLNKFDIKTLQDRGFVQELESHLLECHEHAEFRVRTATAQVLGSLVRSIGLPIFHRFIGHVTKGIEENLERNPETPATEKEASQKELELAKDRDSNLSRSSLSIFHDTAGWKNLETWMKCLQELVASLTPTDFASCKKMTLLTLVEKAIHHTNRFVRETGYSVLGTLIEAHVCHDELQESPTSPIFIQVAKILSTGLADNWSQVRMAASKATRIFFATPEPSGHTFPEVYSLLLPPMCLNRYYVAEGVRIYSQDTWCQVTKGNGRQLIGSILTEALDYYIQQSDADNHAVREAACAAIAECVTKLEADLLRPNLVRIIEALLICFSDQSWPVRDAACLALGSMVATFPEETKTAGYTQLMSTQFLRNLSDSIPSVRGGAAVSISRILAAAKDEALDKLYTDYILSKLADVSKQAAESLGADCHRLSGRGPGVSHVIVAEGGAAHDDKHTDQTMYSCGSLAPKLLKGRKAGGCHDGLGQRVSEPWELADGAVRLLGEFSTGKLELIDNKLVTALVEACSHTNYRHYGYFMETVCKTVTQLCNSLSKMQFKRYLDDLLPVLANAVESKLPLAVAAAEESLHVIGQLIGPIVLRGRIDYHMDSRLLQCLVPYVPPPIN